MLLCNQCQWNHNLRYYCKYSELQRDRRGFRKWKRVDIEESQVYQTIFKTSDEEDGLIVSATEKVIIKDNAPDADTLRSKCNWYKCSIEWYFRYQSRDMRMRSTFVSLLTGIWITWHLMNMIEKEKDSYEYIKVHIMRLLNVNISYAQNEHVINITYLMNIILTRSTFFEFCLM